MIPVDAWPKFNPGELFASLEAREICRNKGISIDYIAWRHFMGDFGDNPELAKENERALLQDEPVRSQYRIPGGHTLVVVTDAQRETTQVDVLTPYVIPSSDYAPIPPSIFD